MYLHNNLNFDCWNNYNVYLLMKFAIEVLQNRLDLLTKQQIGIEKCKCNKDVEKQMELRKKIKELNGAINTLKSYTQLDIEVQELVKSHFSYN